MTRPLGIALAAMALLAADSPPVFAQLPATQAQELPRPAEAPAAEVELAKPTFLDKWLSINSKPPSAMESWLSGVELTCTGCGGFETRAIGPETTNVNAPWVLQGKWQRQTPLGVFSTGFVGVRNSTVPLAAAMPIGGEIDPNTIRSLRSTVFAPLSQWSLTASVEKTLVTRKSGATVGVIADVLMPVAGSSALVDDARTSALPSRTVRVGIIFRW